MGTTSLAIDLVIVAGFFVWFRVISTRYWDRGNVSATPVLILGLIMLVQSMMLPVLYQNFVVEKELLADIILMIVPDFCIAIAIMYFQERSRATWINNVLMIPAAWIFSIIALDFGLSPITISMGVMMGAVLLFLQPRIIITLYDKNRSIGEKQVLRGMTTVLFLFALSAMVLGLLGIVSSWSVIVLAVLVATSILAASSRGVLGIALLMVSFVATTFLSQYAIDEMLLPLAVLLLVGLAFITFPVWGRRFGTSPHRSETPNSSNSTEEPEKETERPAPSPEASYHQSSSDAQRAEDQGLILDAYSLYKRNGQMAKAKGLRNQNREYFENFWIIELSNSESSARSMAAFELGEMAVDGILSVSASERSLRRLMELLNEIERGLRATAEAAEEALRKMLQNGKLSVNQRAVLLEQLRTRHSGRFPGLRNALEAMVSSSTTRKRTYYEVLGVHPMASAAEIKKAYRTMALRYHPDVTKENKAYAQEMMKEINEAHDTLIDPAKRRSYDQSSNP